MIDQTLAGARILVVEDEYYLADEARQILSHVGADIIGPVPTVAQARAVMDANTRIDGALLDVNLRGELVFDLADALQARAIPFAFATGYDGNVLPDRFAERPVLNKPVRPEHLIDAFERLITEARARE
ncbi:response regulator [Sphingomonas sp. PB2P19]|uniref:response regulator n=1 Tax=Sphingomonas rhamnosi TaxID=3096156 RepID=UPI002FCCAF4B